MGRSAESVRSLAARAGVSPSTVSRVLNGRAGIGTATRRKVLELLKEHPLASRGATRRRALMVLMPRRELYPASFYSHLRTLLDSLAPEWDLLLLPSGITAEELKLRLMHNPNTGFFLFAASAEELAPDLLAEIRQYPHVRLNSYRSAEQRTSVLMGNELAGRLAARYLLGRGCRSCALAEVPSDNPSFSARSDGFRFEFFTQHKEYRAVRLAERNLMELSLAESEQAAAEAVRRGDFEGVDGVFVPECYLIPGLHLALRRALPPEKFPRLVCCNRSAELFAGLYPKPAVIELGLDLRVELALRELLRQIGGGAPEEMDAALFLSPKLREPDAPEPSGSPAAALPEEQEG